MPPKNRKGYVENIRSLSTKDKIDAVERQLAALKVTRDAEELYKDKRESDYMALRNDIASQTASIEDALDAMKAAIERFSPMPQSVYGRKRLKLKGATSNLRHYLDNFSGPVIHTKDLPQDCKPSASATVNILREKGWVKTGKMWNRKKAEAE